MKTIIVTWVLGDKLFYLISMVKKEFAAFSGEIETIESRVSDKLTVHFAKRKRHMMAEKMKNSFFLYGDCLFLISAQNIDCGCLLLRQF